MADSAPVPVPTLASARVRLRPYRDADADALLALYSDAAVVRYWSFAPWTRAAEAEAYLQRAAAHAAQGLALPWAIADAASDVLVGTATLHSLQPEQGRAEIGYALAPAHQGRGIASEALRLLLGHAFGPLRLRRIEADVDPRNIASCRLLEALGFTREGLLRERWRVAGETCDSALYGLLAREFVATSRVGAPG
jgi:RimJ/RimL family protein N-acetyltransferase